MSKAVFFDLDGTIRGTKSGAVAPSSPHDHVLGPQVIFRLVVVFSHLLLSTSES